jgi:hypothetical protein
MMAVFQYNGTVKNREDHEESGTVVAQNETEAKSKLAALNLKSVRLKRLSGVSAFLKKLTADIR